jgi:hypothetical protein
LSAWPTQAAIEAWRVDCNTLRPHSALGIRRLADSRLNTIIRAISVPLLRRRGWAEKAIDIVTTEEYI